MKHFTLFKPLLMALMLVGGVNFAWADAGDKITNLNLIFNGSTSGNLTYTLGTGEVANGNGSGKYWSPGVAIDTENSRLKLANANLTFNLANTAEFQDKDIVTISYDVALGYSTKDGNRDFHFEVKNIEGTAIIDEYYNPRNSSRHNSSLGFSRDDMFNPGNANTDWANKVHFEIVINYATGKISASSSCATATNKSHEIAATNLTTDQQKYIASIKLESGDMNNIDHSNLIANLKVITTKGDYSTNKTITYAYKDELGNDITALAISKGATASATADPDDLFTPEYPSSFVDNEFAYDYTYTSGGDAFTVEDDVTITLVYTKSAHPTTDVTVQYKSGGVTVKEEVVAEDYPVGKSISYGVHQYLIGNDGVFYQTATGSNWYYRSADATASLTENVTLSGIDNVIFFTEAEEIEGGTPRDQTSRASNGKVGHTANSSTFVDVTTLNPGTYSICMRTVTSNSGSRTFNFKVGETNVYSYTLDGSNTNNIQKSTTFTVASSSTLKFACEGSNGNGLDWFYIIDEIAEAISDCKQYETSDAFATAVAEKSFSSASDVYAFHTAWQIAKADAASSNDITKVIRNSKVANGTDWNNARLNYDQEYTGAPDNTYFDAWDKDVSNASQTIYGLPAGTYTLKVATRASETLTDIDKYNVWVNGGSADVKALGHHEGSVGNFLGNGWNWTVISFTLDADADVNIGFYSLPGNGSGLWAGCDDWHLYKGQLTYPLTIGISGWATLYTPYALDFSSFSSDFKAYTASLSESTVTLNEVGNVPANTGVVLKGAKGSYNIPVITSSGTTQGSLTGNASATTAYNAFSGYDLYMLALNDESKKVQFTKVSEGSIAAGKAFLKVASDSDVKFFNVVFNDTPTGIRSVDNGQLTKDNAVFNLAGQRVSQPTRGIYIVNGKKVVIK